MNTIDTKIYADRIGMVEKRSSSYGGSDLEIEIENLDTDSMLSDIGIDTAVDYFADELVEKMANDKPDDLLEQIGKDKAIEYFGIVEAE